MPAPIIVAITEDLLTAAAAQLITKWGLSDLDSTQHRAELAADLRDALQSAALATNQIEAPQPDLFGSAP